MAGSRSADEPAANFSHPSRHHHTNNRNDFAFDDEGAGHALQLSPSDPSNSSGILSPSGSESRNQKMAHSRNEQENPHFLTQWASPERPSTPSNHTQKHTRRFSNQAGSPSSPNLRRAG